MGTREHDLVLFGATGFVGRLTAQHLAEHAPAGTKIALAGRSRAKLGALRATLPGDARTWPILVVDAADPAGLLELAQSTTAVATTVGPYAKYGEPLVAACAQAGTHYADLTGEVLFVHAMIERHEAAAKASGARIVHACGFDSVPSDLGVFLTAEAAKADGAGPLQATRLAVRRLKGGLSGGTIDSARNQVAEAVSDPRKRALLGDPWALAEGGRPARDSASGAASSASTAPGAGQPATKALAVLPARVLGTLMKKSPVRKDPDNGNFTGPFVMAAFNTRVVARSASLLHYGPRFRYVEYQDMGPGPKGAATAAATAAVLTAGLAAFALPPARALVDKVLPKPGEGPSEESMAKGRFRMEINATAGPDAKGNDTAYRTVVAAPYDPGYSGTAIMLGQAALALALDALPEAAGILTPASGIGMPLVERLRAHDFTLETSRL